jgi:hypothetical protein
MAYKPLHEDSDLDEAISTLTRISEECALASEAVNRWTRLHKGNLTPAGLLVVAELANTRRKAARKALLSLVNDRISSAYSAGLEDGAQRIDRK